ncbi:hypothetical protein K7X08_020827 [Anisodus acutangulus]|uniref:Uncharacterized protein n=1 Tax=Anisodus acutangulus TaxID=402998 RepID=A0A9Q1MT75_9SOLA|nr:hypothetical protein K7X08_020827 [Anisodus acutangulus]
MEKDHADVVTPDIVATQTQKHEEVTSSIGEKENEVGMDGENHDENAEKQLVLYDPAIAAATFKVKHPSARKRSLANYTSRAAKVGAFAVQCARCFKWRYIPTMEKYEVIREHLLEQLFYCETTREWNSNKSCEDPPDLTQDGSRPWAIDKPNIPLPPPGWERLLRIRAESGTSFADVYYVTPSGKQLRSKVQIQKYLEQHSEYVTEGVKDTQFSFQIPRPLQQNYVKKRLASSLDESISIVVIVNPISWVVPVGNTGLLGGPASSAPSDTVPLDVPVSFAPSDAAPLDVPVPSAPCDAAPLDVPDGYYPKKPKRMVESDIHNSL